MARTRASAKAAGARFELVVADYLAAELDDYIDRKVRTGAKDTGDIGGVRVRSRRLVLECKDVSRMALPEWTAEAKLEAENDGSVAGLVVHKRHGNAKPGDQWVTCTVDDLIAVLKAARDV